MKRYFIEKEKFNEKSIVLDGTEHNHLKNVMRTQIGEEVTIVTGDAFDYLCRVENIDKNKTYLSLISKQPNLNEPKRNVTVYQAMTKSDNMNLIVQKLTELGISRLIPFENAYVTAKDKNGKTDKLQNISNQSIKQCKRACPIQVENTISFKKLLSQMKDYDVVIFANECEKTQSLSSLKFPYQNIAIIVGSEGGFSEQEIAQLTAIDNVVSVSLGRRILRAETASIVLAGTVMFLQGEWDYE